PPARTPGAGTLPAAPPPAVVPPPDAEPRPADREAGLRQGGRPVVDREGRFQDCADCPPMVVIEPGTFVMGSSAHPTEQPTHQVSLRRFAIGVSPVTVAEWSVCQRAGACDYKPTGEPERPVSNLSFDDAQQYVTWISRATRQLYRLPSEAEWEFAARGGTTTRYWWGNTFRPDLAACTPAGSAPPAAPPPVDRQWLNRFGVGDSLCSVAQWTADCWHRNFQRAPTDGSAWVVGGSCQQRVLRGGSWMAAGTSVRMTSRNFYDSSVRYPANGFRIARDF
ncbi:formylglycine-generating enzyme family protein, partial [Methylobacterium crusticola]